MKAIEILPQEAIEESLKGSKREYLVGDLQLPQALSYIEDKDVEAGLTSYREMTIEKPHYHKTTTEYIYMLEGESKYWDLKSKTEIHVKKGDFFVIRKHTVYAQKSKANTKLLFFKYPAGNDKVPAEEQDELKDWYAQW